MKPQLILAVSALGLFRETVLKNGVTPMPLLQVVNKLQTAGLWLGVRDTLEKDSNFLQIIPYVVLRDGDKYVKYTRTEAGGEKRLHNKVSIGVGGHVDGRDIKWQSDSTVSLARTLDLAAQREVIEEVEPEDRNSRDVVGLLTDFSDEVGCVHLGVVEIWDITGHKLMKTEEALKDVSFATLEELEQDRPHMEKWSQHVLDYLKQHNGSNR